MSTSFGKYDLRREIARGAGFVVYEATDRSLQREVALKILLPPDAADAAERARAAEQFQREARALTGLSHPNLAAVLDAGEEGGGCYLAMELLRGSTLRERLLSQGPLPASEVTRIGIALCQALEQMHRRGLVHREVTPDNIMLLPDGRVKLTGYRPGVQGSGFSRGSEFRVGPIHQPSTINHQPSPHPEPYASPEQLAGAPPDGRADIFALGATLCEAATGKHPGEGPAPALPDFLRAILDRAMEYSPSDRYPDAGAMAVDLQLERLSPRAEVDTAPRSFTTPGPAPDSLATGRVATETAAPPAPPDWTTRAQDPLLFPRPVAGAPLAPPPASHSYMVPGLVVENTSGMGASAQVPSEIAHQWNWGAFMLPFFWGIANRVWTGLICLSLMFCPPLGVPATLVTMILMGVHGNEWAWRNRRWENLEDFRRTQRVWSAWGIGVLIAMACLLVVALSTVVD